MNSERKLRAACDRCHELKNRCTRTCGPEARCDRCERLDIDCVYNTTARMGRPRLPRPVSENHKGVSSDGNSHARHAKRRAVQAETPRGATTMQIPVARVDPASAAAPAHNRSGGASSGNPDSVEPVVGFLDPLLLQEAIPGDNLHWDMRLYSPDFAHVAQNDPQGGGRYGQEHGYPHQGSQLMESMRHVSKETSVFSDSGLGDSEKETVPFVKTAGAHELLRLQSHMSNLLACASGPHAENQPALDEVLVACKDLLELLPVSAARCPEPDLQNTSNGGSGTGTSCTPTGVNPEEPDGCRGISESTPNKGRLFDPLEVNYITVLQIATSYACALQVLDLAVDSLMNQTGNLVPISMGSFNLPAQSAMSTSVGAYMISSMVHELRDAISLLMPGYQQQDRPPRVATPHSGLRPSSSAANSSIQAAVNMVSDKEASLLEKLAQAMANP